MSDDVYEKAKKRISDVNARDSFEEWLQEEDIDVTLPCSICGEQGRFRYAPCDPNPHTKGVTRDCWPPEQERWRCTEHQPYDATVEGWNGEWDDFYPEEISK